jgi:hypothetical protein
MDPVVADEVRANDDSPCVRKVTHGRRPRLWMVLRVSLVAIVGSRISKNLKRHGSRVSRDLLFRDSNRLILLRVSAPPLLR